MERARRSGRAVARLEPLLLPVNVLHSVLLVLVSVVLDSASVEEPVFGPEEVMDKAILL